MYVYWYHMYVCMHVVCHIHGVCKRPFFSVHAWRSRCVYLCVCVCVSACVRACVSVRAFEPLLMSALCASFCLMFILKIKKIHFDVHYVFYVY